MLWRMFSMRQLRAAITEGILEASKLLSQFRRSGSPDAVDPLRERMDLIIRNLTARDRTEVKEILFRAQTIYAATGLRLGLKPMFRESMSERSQAEILAAAQERLAASRQLITEGN